MGKRILVLAVAVLVAAGAVQASTGTIEGEYVGVGPGGTLTVSGVANGTYQAGVYQIQVTNSPAATGEGVKVYGQRDGADKVYTFCMDLRQSAPTSFVNFNVDYVDNAPSGPGNTTTGSIAGVWGSSRAEDLRILFGYLKANSGNGLNINLYSPDLATAVQALVWEIVFETNTGAYNLASGGQVASGSSPAGALGTANTILAAISANPNAITPELKLRALTSYTSQDFALYVPSADDQPVPEPLTMASVFLGISGLGMYIRRRTKAPVAV